MIQPGSKVAHYEIVSALGKGGMGEVWRAKDTKLGREVAIKTLPMEFAEDADRLARFEREAKLLASLNHPNIAGIYGFENDGGTRFLALELVEGPTLEDRIKQGALPVEQALKLALQIAEALEAAHVKGVIHRDLKPANIKVTDDGKVKVLDFGLAKAFAGEDANVNLSNSPTLSMAATQQGIILGTAAYMSPEQASGGVADRRSDIWSFGVVLFEMLIGRQVFTGETVSHILADVLKSNPPWDSLPANLHPRLRLMLERCLEKDRKSRYHDIADARIDIQKMLADPSGVIVRPVTEAVQAPPQSKLPWVAAFILGAISAGLAVWSLMPEPSVPVTRFSHFLPDGQQFTGTARNVVAVSPDSSRMVYVANQQLYLKEMDTLEAIPISGTAEDPATPFFSPDSQFVGFWSRYDNQLKRIAVAGGAPVTIVEADVAPYGAPRWGADNTIVWSQAEGIMRVSSNGGTPELLVAAEGRELLGPQMLPDGDSLLFTVRSDPNVSVTEREIVVQSLESGDLQVLFPGVFPWYLPTGHILYVVENVLFAVPFDVDRLEVTGGPVPLVRGVGTIQYDVSDSGSLVYVPAFARGNRVLTWMDRDGRAEPIDTIPPSPPTDGPYLGPRLSPDGNRVLVTKGGDQWIYDIASGRESRITLDGLGVRDYAEWDPTGTRIAYSSRRGGDEGSVWIESVDGSDEPRQITDVEGGRMDVDSWAPDGRTLAVHKHDPVVENIFMVPLDEAEPQPEPFLIRPDFADGGTVFSPDGRYVAYASAESGQMEIQIRPYPGPGGQVTASVNGGTMPVWAPTGELFYRNLSGLMSVSVVTDPELIVGPPRQVFQAPPVSLDPEGVSPRPDYDVTADGERFLMLVSDTPSERSQINIVLNWFEELKERVPVD